MLWKIWYILYSNIQNILQLQHSYPHGNSRSFAFYHDFYSWSKFVWGKMQSSFQPGLKSQNILQLQYSYPNGITFIREHPSKLKKKS